MISKVRLNQLKKCLLVGILRNRLALNCFQKLANIEQFGFLENS